MCCVSAFDKVEHWKELQSLVSNNILLSTDVLVFLRDAGHLPNADSILDVFELQTQVLTRDGQHGSSLPRACLWKQLDGRTNYDIIHVIQNVTINIYPKVHPKNCVCVFVCVVCQPLWEFTYGQFTFWKNQILATSLKEVKNDLGSINSASTQSNQTFTTCQLNLDPPAKLLPASPI